MTPFAQELRECRESLGYRTASSFFEWLKTKGISFKYSYYMRLEKDGLPSEKIVKELTSSLKKDAAERLVLAYCRSLFPRQEYLFTGRQETSGKTDLNSSNRESASTTPEGQKELTPRQVAALAGGEVIYHLFLLSTLARRPIRNSEVEKWYSSKVLSAALRVLSESGLVLAGKGYFEHTAVELRFPDAYSSELAEAYSKFDLWDESFGRKVGLEQMVNKMLVRRVSGRYLLLVRKQLELLFDLTKTSDELDSRYNENVLQLKVSLRQGRLPG